MIVKWLIWRLIASFLRCFLIQNKLIIFLFAWKKIILDLIFLYFQVWGDKTEFYSEALSIICLTKVIVDKYWTYTLINIRTFLDLCEYFTISAYRKVTYWYIFLDELKSIIDICCGKRQIICFILLQQYILRQIRN